MSAAAKTGRMLILTSHSIIDTFVIIVILLLFAFGCYAVWDSGQIHNAAHSARYERFKPTQENSGATFEELQAINPEVIAWLTVYGTNIDYPVTQGTDNMKYVNTNAEGRHSLSGAIFLDYRNSPHFTDFNSIFYGHHMENNVMFGEITSFSNEDFFKDHRYGSLFADGKTHGIEFFAFVHADANDTQVFRPNITNPEAQQRYLDTLMEMAVIVRDDVNITTQDRIVLLSTCSPNETSRRDILVGRIINYVPDDPFSL